VRAPTASSHILQVPWHTQLWAGAVEVGLLWLAAVQSSRRGPHLQEGAQLLVYSLLLYLVPLAAVLWQQQKDGVQGVPSRAGRAGSTLAHKPIHSKSDLASGSKPGTSCPSGGTNKGAELTAQAGEGRARHKGAHSEQAAVALQQHHQPALAAAAFAHATAPSQPRASTLYTSPLQHTCVSVKVSATYWCQVRVQLSSHPKPHFSAIRVGTKCTGSICRASKHISNYLTGSLPQFDQDCICTPCIVSLHAQAHQSAHEAAATLQQYCQAALQGAMPSGQLVHMSSAWVRGCVQVFMWAAHLPQQLLGSATGHPASAKSTPISSALTGQTSSTIPRLFAGAAAAAGAEGDVDVQVGQQQPQRYQLAPDDAEPALVPASALSGGDVVTATEGPSVELLSISPACLVLSDLETAAAVAADGSTSASTHFSVQLASRHAQQARVILMAAAAGVVLMDRTYNIASGGLTTLRMDVSSVSLARLVGRHGPNRNEARGPHPVIPLRVVITTPTNQLDQPKPPQLAHVHATATLLAAPGPLASELCTLYEAMEDEGRAQGLSGQEVWAAHWQQLMNDLAVCLMAADNLSSGAGATASTDQQLEAVKEAATPLAEFFSDHGLGGWQVQMQGVLQALGLHQVESRQPSAEEQVPATAAVHRDVPSSTLSAKPSTSQHTPEAETSASSCTQHPGAAPAAEASTGKGDRSNSADASSKCSSNDAPRMKHLNLAFSDRAQEVRYRDWAMRRARVPVLVW
jgi:hypothetical protein